MIQALMLKRLGALSSLSGEVYDRLLARLEAHDRGPTITLSADELLEVASCLALMRAAVVECAAAIADGEVPASSIATANAYAAVLAGLVDGIARALWGPVPGTGDWTAAAGEDEPR